MFHSKLTSVSTDSLLAVRSFLEASVPFYDYAVSHARLFECCRELLGMAFPSWDLNAVVFEQCKDGITNKCMVEGETFFLHLIFLVMKCTNVAGEGQVVLIRAYGKKSELIIDRLAELVNFVTLSRVGLSPPLYGRFRNGFVYGYVEGHVFRVSDMSDTHKSTLVARKMAEWHRIHLPGRYEPQLFNTLWKWHDGIPQSYSVEETQQRFLKHIDISYLARQIARLEGLVATLRSPVVFCHNDLLSANIIYQPKLDEVAFIDFEYGSHNYRGFDIGNHFCEWAGFECDYGLYPGKERQMSWLTNYHRAFNDGAAPTDEEMEALLKEVSIFALTSHLYWGLWGLVQASFSDIPFDYMGYAIMRFNQYRLTCNQTLQ